MDDTFKKNNETAKDYPKDDITRNRFVPRPTHILIFTKRRAKRQKSFFPPVPSHYLDRDSTTSAQGFGHAVP